MKKIYRYLKCKYCKEEGVYEIIKNSFKCKKCKKKNKLFELSSKGPLIQKGYTDELGIYHIAPSSPRRDRHVDTSYFNY
jgi:hypothetical protein